MGGRFVAIAPVARSLHPNSRCSLQLGIGLCIPLWTERQVWRAQQSFATMRVATSAALFPITAAEIAVAFGHLASFGGARIIDCVHTHHAMRSKLKSEAMAKVPCLEFGSPPFSR